MAIFTGRTHLTTADVGDTAVWQRLAYVFELRSKRAPPMFRPILLGPSSVTIQRDFAKHIEIAHDGAVHVAEYGMITGQISITVETGLRARSSRNPISGDVYKLTGLGRYKLILNDILKTYSKLKQVAEIAVDTSLVLHVLKDSESFIVAPSTHTLQRTSAAPLSSPYTLELDILGMDTQPSLAKLSPDRSVLEAISDVGRSVRRAVQSARACVDELTAYTSEVRMAAASWTGILNDVTAVVEAAGSFVDGVKDVLDVPRAFVVGVVGALEAFRELTIDVATTPAAITQWWAELADQMDVIASYPETFVETLGNAVAGRQAWQLGSSGYSAAELESASGTIYGTGARASDSTRASGGRPITDSAPPYAGWVEVQLGATDTAAGLAARYGASWPDVAAANRIRPPYISEAMIPYTVAPGDRIIVPAAYASDRAFSTRSSAAAALGESVQAEVFGTDFLLDSVEGFAIDTDRGSLDLSTVTGVDNVAQGVGIKLGTFKSDNLAYPDQGLPYRPGERMGLEEEIIMGVVVTKALQSDRRIEEVTRVEVTQDGDSLAPEIDMRLVNGASVRAHGPLLI